MLCSAGRGGAMLCGAMQRDELHCSTMQRLYQVKKEKKKNTFFQRPDRGEGGGYLNQVTKNEEKKMLFSRFAQKSQRSGFLFSF